MELDPKNIRSDELSESEAKEICKEVTARNKGDLCALSPYATSNDAAIRRYPHENRFGVYEYDQNPFQEDSRRVSFTNDYERLARKTQVCTNPTKDHIASRLIHTDRVALVSKAIARALGANEDLTEAIARAHDIGHAPLGHLGEQLITRAVFDLNKDLLGVLGVFKHNVHGVHVVDRVAVRRGFPDGGLNLTDQVRHGILSHDGEAYGGYISPNRELGRENLSADIDKYMSEIIKASGSVEIDVDVNNPSAVDGYMRKVEEAVKRVVIVPATLEACIVFIVDVLHYCPEDFEDLVSLGEAKREHLPLEVASKLGTNGADMMHTMITDLVVHSYGKDKIGYSEEIGKVLNDFKRSFLYPYYYKVNSWAYSYARDSRVDLPPTPKVGLKERMNFLFSTYEKALRDPGGHPQSSVVAQYLSGRDVKTYFSRMRLVPDEYKLYQALVDYVAGFTDRYFFSESENMHR